MTPVPKRRWFRFSLGALFVVLTVFCVCLGYPINWIQQRRAAIDDPALRTTVTFIEEFAGLPSVSAPWPLAWFGEQGYSHILILSETSDADAQRVRNLFPEASAEPFP